MRLARKGQFPIYGFNYKDERDKALRWLKRRGDPYQAIAFDRTGRVGIDLGVYGVPETYIVDKAGVIRYKQIGPLTEAALEDKVLPLIHKLQSKES